VKPTIVWINGAFGSGKTSLARELVDRMPDTMLYDPELVGFMLRAIVPAADSGDFQDLPIWRELAADVATALRRNYDRRLVVPMTLVRPEYRQEVFGRLKRSGESVMHLFLDVSEPEVARRIETQVMYPDDPTRDAEIRSWRLRQLPSCTRARDSLPPATVVLPADGIRVDQLADQVLQRLAAVDSA
jgi:AAA domain